MAVTLHTSLGDIKLEVFCDSCPKTAENFLALCGTDYYNNCIFTRNIKVIAFTHQMNKSPSLKTNFEFLQKQKRKEK